MKILVYGINYYPELTGIGKYTGEMCEWLASESHDVEVITAMPYYPEWQVHPAYRDRWWFTENIKGVKVRRCPFYVPKQVSGSTRILHEFSFLLSSLVFWIRTFFKRYDTVICVYPPLVIGFLPMLYQWLYNCPLVFHIQDLQVDAARDLNIIKNQRLLRIFERLEGFYLRHATVITTISTGMRDKIVNKGISIRKVKLFPNWVDAELLKPMQDQRDWFKALYGYAPYQKVVLYAGNIGKKQGLETIINIAETLQQQQREDIQFMISGEGNDKSTLMEMVAERRLTNVKFGPLVPVDELPQLLNMADLHLVLQRKGATDLVMPSKLGNILSCGGVPLIASERDSTLRKLSEEYGFGVNAEPEDAEDIQNMMESFFMVKAHDHGLYAREYAVKFLGKDAILHDFNEQIGELVTNRRARRATVSQPSPAGSIKVD